jgi:hypothetical protein
MKISFSLSLNGVLLYDQPLFLQDLTRQDEDVVQ